MSARTRGLRPPMRTKNEPWSSPQETKMSIETFFGWMFLLLSMALSIFLFFGLYLQLISILVMFKGLAQVPKQESASLRNLRRKSRKKKLMSIQRSDKNELIRQQESDLDASWSSHRNLDKKVFYGINYFCCASLCSKSVVILKSKYNEIHT